MTTYWLSTNMLLQRGKICQGNKFLSSVAHRYSNNCGNQVRCGAIFDCLKWHIYTRQQESMPLYKLKEENETVCGCRVSRVECRWISLYLTSVQAGNAGEA